MLKIQYFYNNFKTEPTNQIDKKRMMLIMNPNENQ